MSPPAAELEAVIAWAEETLSKLHERWRGDDRDRSTVRAVLGALRREENPRLRNAHRPGDAPS